MKTGLKQILVCYFHFSFSRIGEGNGNPLQCSCLENPRDGGAWWATGYGVAQSRRQLERLSSSSSSVHSSTVHSSQKVAVPTFSATDGYTKSGIYIQWNITYPLKKGNLSHTTTRKNLEDIISSVQSLSHVRLFATP